MRRLATQGLDLPFSLAEWKFFGAVIAANLALNVAAMWVEHWFILLSRGLDYPSAWMEGFALACVFTQVVILGIWSALFPGSNLLRVLLSTLAVCAGFYLLTWLTRAIAPAVLDYRGQLGLRGLSLIVTFFYVVQIPFWFLRFVFGWKIVRMASEPHEPPQRHRFTMLQMLGWATFLSVPLGFGQVYHGERAADVALIVGSMALVSWLCGVPYLWATLGARRLLWGLLICVPFSAVTTLLGSYMYHLAYFAPWSELLLQAFMFVLAGASLVGLGTGIAARLFGYRLMPYARDRHVAR